MKKPNSLNEANRSDAYGFTTFFKDGKYYFQFKETSGRPILFSQGYATEKSRNNGIQSVIRNAKKDKQYEFKKGKKDKKGKRFFILKAGNHQEIGRSDLFGNKEELEEKLAIIKAIQLDVPILEKTTKEKGIKNLPRHKFSLIYYPDSKVWQIKHDHSENSKEFKTYNSQLIESFVKQHLPAELNTLPTSKAQKTKQISPKHQPMPAVAQAAPQPTQEQIELKIRTHRRELVKSVAKANQLGLLEVTTKNRIPNTEQPYFGQVIAKSLNSSKATIIAEVKALNARAGALFIPINDANKLNPGWYRFNLTLQQGNKGRVLSGSQVVLLN